MRTVRHSGRQSPSSLPSCRAAATVAVPAQEFGGLGTHGNAVAGSGQPAQHPAAVRPSSSVSFYPVCPASRAPQMLCASVVVPGRTRCVLHFWPPAKRGARQRADGGASLQNVDHRLLWQCRGGACLMRGCLDAITGCDAGTCRPTPSRGPSPAAGPPASTRSRCWTCMETSSAAPCPPASAPPAPCPRSTTWSSTITSSQVGCSRCKVLARQL